jgi:hypothetical protein
MGLTGPRVVVKELVWFLYFRVGTCTQKKYLMLLSLLYKFLPEHLFIASDFNLWLVNSILFSQPLSSLISSVLHPIYLSKQLPDSILSELLLLAWGHLREPPNQADGSAINSCSHTLAESFLPGHWCSLESTLVCGWASSWRNQIRILRLGGPVSFFYVKPLQMTLVCSQEWQSLLLKDNYLGPGVVV